MKYMEFLSDSKDGLTLITSYTDHFLNKSLILWVDWLIIFCQESIPATSPPQKNAAGKNNKTSKKRDKQSVDEIKKILMLCQGTR